MAMQAIRAARKETVPGVPSRLPALAGGAFGTFILVLSGNRDAAGHRLDQP